MKSVLTVIGTRPEAIKLAPVLLAIDKKKNFESKVCLTRQHTDLLDPFLINLGIKADYQLDNFEKKSLHQNTAHMLERLGLILAESKPDLVIVQGDTTTAFTAALAAFYACIPVAHIEAGLRTGQLYSPWPEEAHRSLIGRLATYSFAPTVKAKNTLIMEGVSSDKVWVVGNTSIDAIRLLKKHSELIPSTESRIIVVTVHRRENHGERLKKICHALKTIAEMFSDVIIQFFLHPNPSVRYPVIEMLSGITNIQLIDPKDHSSFIQHLDACSFVMTDSGGIQEEAPFMGKPVIIIRDTTERPEGVEAGTAKLVGTESENIIESCKDLLANPEKLETMSKVHFPYGDGFSAERIADILEEEFKVLR